MRWARAIVVQPWPPGRWVAPVATLCPIGVCVLTFPRSSKMFGRGACANPLRLASVKVMCCQVRGAPGSCVLIWPKSSKRFGREARLELRRAIACTRWGRRTRCRRPCWCGGREPSRSTCGNWRRRSWRPSPLQRKAHPRTRSDVVGVTLGLGLLRLRRVSRPGPRPRQGPWRRWSCTCSTPCGLGAVTSRG